MRIRGISPFRRSTAWVGLVVAVMLSAACSGDDATTDATVSTVSSPLSTIAVIAVNPTPDSTTVITEATLPAMTAPSLTSPQTTPPDTSAPESTSPDAGAPAAGSTAAFEAIVPEVDEYLTANAMNGAGLVVVDREDGIVFSHYWGEFDADRQSFVASSSKMITAGVLARLADDGLLDLDAPIADAVAWGSGNPEITPAQLVSNSSGLVGLGPEATYPPYLCQFVPGDELEACAERVFLTPDDDADIVAPDTEFRYGGAQWQVAGGLAEAVSGKPWEQLIDEIYVQPCGVDSLGYNNHWIITDSFDYPVGVDPESLEPTENPHMEGGVYISAPDYAELLLMHLRGGECENGRVMSAEAIDRLHADRTLEAYSGELAAIAPGYGMGWWIDRNNGRISDGGAYGSQPWLDLDEGYGAYLVVEATSLLGGRLSAKVEPLIDAAMQVYRSS